MTDHSIFKKISLWIFIALLAYVPLHIFISTWLGSLFHILPVAKAAKDVIAIGGLVSALIVGSQQLWFKQFLKDKLVWLIVGYGILTGLLALIKPTDNDAELLGILYNLRFLIFFVYGALLTQLFDNSVLRKAIKGVLFAALPVLIFGILQQLILPDDALTHVGYTRANGVLPAFFIDDKPDLERVMSTLRDPNSFGSYLIIVLSLALTYRLMTKNPHVKKLLSGYILLGVMCLWFTFSRSAWIGALLSLVSIFALIHKDRIKKFNLRKIGISLGAVLVLALLVIYPLRNTYFVQNVIFHADESTVMEDPNELRVRYWNESLQAGVRNPFGSGPGTAGLASIRNQEQGTILNENYYLQLLHEVGVIGLGLFLSILIIVGRRLNQRSVSVAAALFAAFVGLAFTNALVHIWSNEAVAYTWWGLAGILLFSGASTNKVAKNKQTKQARLQHK